MRQLLVTIMAPPLVGLVTYAVLRLIWKKRGDATDRMAARHRIDVH